MPTPLGVSWNASDHGSGVQRSYLYVKPPGASSFSYAFRSAVGSSGTFSYTPSRMGTHEFAVRSVDAVGNWERTPLRGECSTIVLFTTF